MSIPIPEADWDRVWDFLTEGKTGQITLNVHQGHVVSVSLSESWKIKPLDSPPAKA